MKKMDFCESFGEIKEEYIAAAHAGAKSRKKSFIRWAAAAACLCLLLVGIFAVQGGWFADKTQRVMLADGETLVFTKTGFAASSLDLAIETRAMTPAELTAVFGALPVTGNACYRADTHEFIGLEGRYADMKLVISVSDVQLLDAVVVGEETPSVIGGIPVTAGYYVSRPNSRGEKTAIYYASIALDACTVYLENAGPEAQSIQLREALACAVEAFAAASFDFGVLAE